MTCESMVDRDVTPVGRSRLVVGAHPHPSLALPAIPYFVSPMSCASVGQCGVSFALSVLCELNNVAAGCLGAVRLAGWSPGSGAGHASATVRVRLLGLGRDERAAKSLPSVGAVLPLLWLANTTTTDTRGLCVVHAAAQAANRTHLGAFLAKNASNSPQQGGGF